MAADDSSEISGKNKVGYGNPPEHTRFKKGQSGNPRGRPKGSQNLPSVLGRILGKPVRVRENGSIKTVTTFEYALSQMAKKAISGDLRAVQQLIRLQRAVEEQAPPEKPQTPLAEADQKVLQRILQRIQATPIQKEKDDDESRNQ